MRRWWLPLMIGFFLVPLPVLGAPTAANACSCAIGSPEEFVEYADIVMTGEVTDIDRSQVRSGSDEPVAYRVQVDQVYLGQAQEVTVFTSAAEEASCGLAHVSTGSTYVFFLRSNERGFSADLCGGTQLLPSAGPLPEALDSLGGTDPLPGEGGAPWNPEEDGRGWWMGVGAVAVAIGTVYLVRRRAQD